MNLDPNQLKNGLGSLWAYLQVYGLKVLGAFVILIVGRLVAGSVRRSVAAVGVRRNWDPGLIGFVGSLAYFFVMAFTLVAVLGSFGVQTASLVAVLGAASFAVGLALQGSLSNFAAGVMLMIFRPFKVGDYIDAAGVAGSVKEIGIFSTTLATPDNVLITVPNSKLYGDTIKNYAGYTTRRIDLTIGISYKDDIGQAIAAIDEVVRSDARVLAEPAPMIAVGALGASSVDLVVRPWVNVPDYWDVRFALTRQIKESLDAAGIEIPFPQTVVTMIQPEH